MKSLLQQEKVVRFHWSVLPQQIQEKATNRDKARILGLRHIQYQGETHPPFRPGISVSPGIR